MAVKHGIHIVSCHTFFFLFLHFKLPCQITIEHYFCHGHIWKYPQECNIECKNRKKHQWDKAYLQHQISSEVSMHHLQTLFHSLCTFQFRLICQNIISHLQRNNQNLINNHSNDHQNNTCIQPGDQHLHRSIFTRKIRITVNRIGQHGKQIQYCHKKSGNDHSVRVMSVKIKQLIQ